MVHRRLVVLWLCNPSWRCAIAPIKALYDRAYLSVISVALYTCVTA